MTAETFSFQTEVGRLLDIVAHSLYSHKEIFLRELISNASDACDRLRYAALTDASLAGDDSAFAIRIVPDREKRTLAVIDNGIGMNREDLIATLGTIARSGTQAFLTQLSGDAKKDLALIGQFGVGFYSAFMVADRVEVLTRRAGEEQAWLWSSDGRGSFSIDEASRDRRGTTVTLHLNAEADEFLEEHRIRRIVKQYSDHIGFPILLGATDKEDKGPDKLNVGTSLWLLPKKDITKEQYEEFYHHVGHAFDEPWLTLHNQVEGVVSYTNLLFIPSTAPFDLFDPQRKGRVKLYVRRVYITDDCEGLLPSWLRFLRGVVDSEDLPLNISRETFQHDPRLTRIRSGLTKRVLDELAKKADEPEGGYTTFWETFGAVLKEGLYEHDSAAFDNRERLLGLVRFRSTAGDGWVSLDQYVERMKPGQDAIFTLFGEQEDALRRSPQLEGFVARGVEVLLLTDPIDEFWIPQIGRFKDKPFKSAAGADADISGIEAPAEASDGAGEAEAAADGDVDRLIAVLKAALATTVKDVRVSRRLTESAVCLVSAEGDMDMHLERMLRQHRQLGGLETTPRILEINPRHALIRALAARAATDGGSDDLTDAAFLLLDQARIVEGDPLPDPVAFAKRLSAVLEKGFAA